MDQSQFEREVEAIFNRINELNAKYHENMEFLPTSHKISRYILIWLVGGPIIVGIILLFVLHILGRLQDISLSFAGLVLISIGYVGIILLQLSVIIEGRKSIAAFFKNPLSILMNQTKKEILVSHAYLASVEEMSIQVLRYVHDHISNERAAFERRVGILVGALEKVGLIPGLVTLALGWAKLAEQKLAIDPWVAVAVFFLYAIAFYCYNLFSRMDLVIKTLETIIEMKDEKTTNNEG